MTAITVATAFLATVLGSISGIGGGVIIKPVMDAVTDFGASTISFLSGTTVLVMTMVSLLRSGGSGIRIDRRGIFLSLGGAVGGFLGKMLFSYVTASSSSAFVSLVQNIVMVILTAVVLVYCVSKERIHKLNIVNPVLCTLIGLFLGLVSAFLGIGGGPINIMFLSYFFSMDTKTSALTSLCIIFFSQAVSFVSTCVTGLPEFSVVILLSMAAAAVIGATIGRGLSKKMDSHSVDILFLFILMLIIAISVYNSIHYASLV